MCRSDTMVLPLTIKPNDAGKRLAWSDSVMPVLLNQRVRPYPFIVLST